MIFKGHAMKELPLRRVWSHFLAMSAFLFMLAQPLWAAEEPPAPQGQQEESFFQGIKRNIDEWLGRDNSAGKAKEEVPKQEARPPQSDGRKAINSFKKGMNKISDNVSESVERDKKTLKKKLDKLRDKK